MAILAALQSASVRLVGRKPSAFFGSSEKFELELCDLVNEVAEDVAQYQDWQALKRVATITGDGATAAFDLPADYGRMLINTELQDLNTWFWGFGHVADLNQFLALEARGFVPTPGAWIIYGGQIRFTPAPSDGQAATFPYITRNKVTAASLAPKAEFTDDTDAFVLPERLLTLALVWRWRENKGLAAQGDEEAFIQALDQYAAKDGGSRVQRRRARRFMAGTHIAWPGVLGPAAY